MSVSKFTALKMLLLFVAIQIICHLSLPFCQAAGWDFQFDFTGYTRQSDDFLLDRCAEDVTTSFTEASKSTLKARFSIITLFYWVSIISTAEMIDRVLQGNALELPTTNLDLPHATCVNDTRMGPTVKFIIYLDDDDFTGQVDKQRIEMKTNEGSKSLTAHEDDSFIYAWWFEIDPQIILHPDNQFLHVFQIKGVGANISSDPLVTFTLSNSRLFHMRLHYGNSSFDSITLMDLNMVKGRWIQVFVEAVFKKTGSVRVIMKDEQGTTLVPDQLYPFTVGYIFFKSKYCNYTICLVNYYRIMNFSDVVGWESILSDEMGIVS